MTNYAIQDLPEEIIVIFELFFAGNKNIAMAQCNALLDSADPVRKYARAAAMSLSESPRSFDEACKTLFRNLENSNYEALQNLPTPLTGSVRAVHGFRREDFSKVSPGDSDLNTKEIFDDSGAFFLSDGSDDAFLHIKKPTTAIPPMYDFDKKKDDSSISKSKDEAKTLADVLIIDDSLNMELEAEPLFSLSDSDIPTSTYLSSYGNSTSSAVLQNTEKRYTIAEYDRWLVEEKSEHRNKNLEEIEASLLETTLDLLRPFERIPVMQVSIVQFMKHLDLDHRYGFILSFIDGVTPIGDILDLAATIAPNQVALILLLLEYRHIISFEPM